MIYLTPVLCLSLLLNVALAFGLTRAVKLLFGIEDRINDSLDLLDKSYASLTKISKTPVLYDDPQIKLAIRELNRARDAVLLVANKVTIDMKQMSEDENDKN